MTKASNEAQEIILDRVPCIYYLVQFRKDKRTIIQALINLSSKVNTISLAYFKQLGFQVQKTDIRAQKIDSSLLQTFAIVIAGIQVKDKLSKTPFLQESFLLTETNIKMVLGMFFLIFSNANIQFAEKKLT